ncbi:MAG: ferrochelatase [Planctomycetota bacterium]|nr:ferrochelatase [Planctomycetota bacterium]
MPDPALSTTPLNQAARPTGVLLINLGSPDAPTPEAVRRYLKQFLSDPAVVDWPRWLWLPILHGIILRTRPARSAALYERVWTDNGSPLIDISQRQAQALQRTLGESWRVECAMRYGNPSVAHGLNTLRDAGCDKIVVLPMFPQECQATTGSVITELEAVCETMQDGSGITVIPGYATDAGYVKAFAATIRETREAHPDIDHMVFSFHGIPARLVTAGDPYQEQCEATAHALAQQLELVDDQWTLVYQSRFGPEAWLRPYAIEAVPSMATTHRKLLVCCPGFTADCLETIDEIGVELRHSFLKAGGEALVLAPCINDRREWIEGMANMVRQALP